MGAHVQSKKKKKKRSKQKERYGSKESRRKDDEDSRTLPAPPADLQPEIRSSKTTVVKIFHLLLIFGALALYMDVFRLGKRKNAYMFRGAHKTLSQADNKLTTTSNYVQPGVCKCKPGRRSDGGKSIDANGFCKHFCSRHGYCGVTEMYSRRGTDCRKSSATAAMARKQVEISQRLASGPALGTQKDIDSLSIMISDNPTNSGDAKKIVPLSNSRQKSNRNRATCTVGPIDYNFRTFTTCPPASGCCSIWGLCSKDRKHCNGQYMGITYSGQVGVRKDMLTKWKLQQMRWKSFHDKKVAGLTARDTQSRSKPTGAVLTVDGTEIHTQHKARWFYINLDSEERHQMRSEAIQSILFAEHEVEAELISRVPAVDPAYLKSRRMSVMGRKMDVISAVTISHLRAIKQAYDSYSVKLSETHAAAHHEPALILEDDVHLGKVFKIWRKPYGSLLEGADLDSVITDLDRLYTNQWTICQVGYTFSRLWEMGNNARALAQASWRGERILQRSKLPMAAQAWGAFAYLVSDQLFQQSLRQKSTSSPESLPHSELYVSQRDQQINEDTIEALQKRAFPMYYSKSKSKPKRQ